MKSLKDHINEGFFQNVGADVRLYDYYTAFDGFQFGWSAGISDSDWMSIFDMNYMRNYYQKYFEPGKTNANLSPNFNVRYLQTKYPKGSKGQSWWGMNEAALVFAILSTRDNTPNQKSIEQALSKFYNKDKEADKDTKIVIKEDKDTYKKFNAIIYRIYIYNDRITSHYNGNLSSKGRPLYIEIMSKEDINKVWSK